MPNNNFNYEEAKFGIFEIFSFASGILLLSIKTITKTRIRALKICKSKIEEFSEIREWQVFYDRKCFRISSKVWRVKCLPKISSSKELKILKSKKKMKFLKSWNRLKMIKLYVFSENCEKVELFFVTRNRDFRFLWSETSNLNEWQQSWMFAKNPWICKSWKFKKLESAFECEKSISR